MNDISLNGGAARLVLAEGHFPLLPWLAVFIAGMMVHRMFHRGRMTLLAVSGAVLLVAGLLLRGLYMYGYAFAVRGMFMRFFIFLPYPYPPLPSFLMVMLGSSLLLFVLFQRMEAAGWTRIVRIIAPLGRTAFSWFIFHILFVNEFLRALGVHKCFGPSLTLLLTAVFLAFAVLLSRLWSRAEYRYGIEWMVRRLAK